MNPLLNVYEDLAAYMGRPADLKFHSVSLPDELKPRVLLVYLLSITDAETVHEWLLVPILECANHCAHSSIPFLEQPAITSLFAMGTAIELDPQSLSLALFEGKCVLIFQGKPYALAVDAAHWNNRSVTKPERESSLIGPKDCFIEDILINLSMIRRRIRHESLRVEEYSLGTKSQTKIMLVYMEGLVNPDALDQFRQRLQSLKIDMVLDASQIGAMVTRQNLCPFPLFQSTERPDKATSALSEGRFLVLTDTTPTCLVLPVTMTCLYEAADDYYLPSVSGTFLRLTRLLGLAITLFLPALYIAITSVNQDVFRIQFMLAVASSREGVPYPAYVEVVIMLLLIELINEATVRLPKTIGGTATIVGGLIIGTAAAQSHLISFIMIVITATTAIGSYTAPNYMVGLAWRLCSFFLVLLAIPLGLYGIVLGSSLVGLYLCYIDSFGVPYAAPFNTFRYKDIIRDALVRAPYMFTKFRPSTYSRKAGDNQRRGGLGERDDW